MPKVFRTFLLTFLLAGCLSHLASANVGVYRNHDIPQVEFAASEINKALSAQGDIGVTHNLADLSQPSQEVRIAIAASKDESHNLAATLSVHDLKPDAPPQAYALRKSVLNNQTTYIVLAADPAGAMYGGLDIAESIKLQTLPKLQDTDHSPFISQRGFKFNIPLDARTPSYSDAGDSAQQNIPEMWSMDFWHEFLDEMARQRYNVLSLWNLHPFPSMVKVPEYPDVALADVMRTTEKFDSTYALTGKDMVRPELLAHLETLKKLTIEQKIKFWQDVMAYANDRGIDVYIFTWNIFTWGADGKYGITTAQDNPATIDYFRKSVRELVLTYPRLAGIGITAGENMQKLKGEFTNEKWLWNTYGQGILDAKKLQPDRTIRLIHRLHQGSMKEMLNEWKTYPDPFDFEYKYSVAHMYSSPTPIFYKKDLANFPGNLRCWMTIRNDDIYSFRWGDPQYARDYIHSLPGPETLAGYFMGPDGFIWGREFTSTEPDSPRQLVTKKQWYSFMLWGRLSYDPTIPDSLFQQTLDTRFPEAPPGKLFAASVSASRIIPQVSRFFWSGNDLAWFPEACISHPNHRGFYSVKDFMKGSIMPGAGIMNIREYSAAIAQGQPIAGVTPLQVAANLHNDAANTLATLSGMPDSIKDKELRLTIGDLKAMSYLGNYYAEKILAPSILPRSKPRANPRTSSRRSSIFKMPCKPGSSMRRPLQASTARNC